MIDVKKIFDTSMIDQTQSDVSYLWIIVACIPFIFQLPLTMVPVWAIGLIGGWWIANKYVLRWVALAWGVSVFFPAMPLLLLACCGALMNGWRQCIYAALLGSVLCLITSQGILNNTGSVLIVIGLALTIYKKLR